MEVEKETLITHAAKRRAIETVGDEILLEESEGTNSNYVTIILERHKKVGQHILRRHAWSNGRRGRPRVGTGKC